MKKIIIVSYIILYLISASTLYAQRPYFVDKNNNKIIEDKDTTIKWRRKFNLPNTNTEMKYYVVLAHSTGDLNGKWEYCKKSSTSCTWSTIPELNNDKVLAYSESIRFNPSGVKITKENSSKPNITIKAWNGSTDEEGIHSLSDLGNSMSENTFKVYISLQKPTIPTLHKVKNISKNNVYTIRKTGQELSNGHIKFFAINSHKNKFIILEDKPSYVIISFNNGSLKGTWQYTIIGLFNTWKNVSIFKLPSSKYLHIRQGSKIEAAIYRFHQAEGEHTEKEGIVKPTITVRTIDKDRISSSSLFIDKDEADPFLSEEELIIEVNISNPNKHLPNKHDLHTLSKKYNTLESKFQSLKEKVNSLQSKVKVLKNINKTTNTTLFVAKKQQQAFLYPNPAKQVLRFGNLSSIETYTYKIYNLAGIQVMAGTELHSNDALNVSTLKVDGNYILVLRTNTGKEVLRSNLVLTSNPKH